LNHEDFHITAKFDQLAIHNNYLVFISLVGYANDVKAMRAALASGIRHPMRVAGVELTRGHEKIVPGDIWARTGVKYSLAQHKLGYGTVHALFTIREKGVLLNDQDETLWAELKHERFTTPLLRAWLPYLRQELAAAGKLKPMFTVGCNFHYLSADSKTLDEIVEWGLQNNQIQIQEESP
jgi:hypothetical protein